MLSNYMLDITRLRNLIQRVKPHHMSVFITFSKDSHIISTAYKTPTYSKNIFSPETADENSALFMSYMVRERK